MVSADCTHEEGVHSYAAINTRRATRSSRRYSRVTSNQHRSSRPYRLPLRQSLALRRPFDSPAGQRDAPHQSDRELHSRSAKTWGCVLGELFDYVDGVCNPLHAFGQAISDRPGKTSRIASFWREFCTLPAVSRSSCSRQGESARPFTLTTPVDVNGFGDTLDDRAVVNGVQTTLDQFRGTPYIQIDLRVSRPFNLGERSGHAVRRILQYFQSQ